MLDAEVIGPGKLLYGPLEGSSLPDPLAAGAPVGQHLRIERLLRVCPRRMLYLVNNLGPKWNRRKCWNCGNRYSPNLAQACTYCATPLQDLRFLMTARWSTDLYRPWEAWVSRRAVYPGVVRPVAVMYRGDLMLSVYHHYGEGLLLDEPSPLSPRRIVRMLDQLAGGLAFFHDSGAVLRHLGPDNVLLMPDGTARWFDMDVDEVMPTREAVYRHPAQPPRRDVRELAQLFLRYCSPDDSDLERFLRGAAHGTYGSPLAFRTALAQLFDDLDVDHGRHEAAAYTDAGLIRDNNEDTWRWRRLTEGAVLYVLADGMGGHDAGELASALAVDRLCQFVSEGLGRSASPEQLTERLRNAFHAANQDVAHRARSAGLTMGTTMVAAIVIDGQDKQAIVANAGDSRAYLLRGNKLQQITKDHTVVAELLEEGAITAEEAETHPAANMLTSSIGAEADVDFDLFKVALRSKDRLFLCSDGLWGHVSNGELSWVLAAIEDQREVLQSLVRSAYADGGSDNLTMQLVDIP
jgi:serine/threonine protein phosphatase PrpC